MIDSLQWWSLVAVAAGAALAVGDITGRIVAGLGVFVAVAGFLTFWFLTIAEDVDV